MERSPWPTPMRLLSKASEAQTKPPLIPLSEIALTGIYEISKILNAPNRLETTLSNVLNVLSSFLQMRHGVISLLADDDVPDVTVGIGWNEGTDERYRARLPETAIRQIIATAVPLVAEDVATHPLFTTDATALGADGDVRVSFIGVPIRIGAKVVGHVDHRSRLGRSIGVPARYRRALPHHDRQSDRPDGAALPRRLARPRSADGRELPSAEGAVGAQAGAGAQEGSHQRHRRRQSGAPFAARTRLRSSPNPIRPCCCAANPAPARS